MSIVGVFEDVDVHPDADWYRSWEDWGELQVVPCGLMLDEDGLDRGSAPDEEEVLEELVVTPPRDAVARLGGRRNR